MDQTPFNLALAIGMVMMIAVLFGWARRTGTTASVRRMMNMMARVRVDPRVSTDTDPDVMYLMKNARRRCVKCPSEGLCEKWLAGEVKGANTFCANASLFKKMAE
ncbi:MAG: hypothetical protein HON65_03405 [Rhodospirillales bacterium]|jgi:hypothetical protein|nr:hypothetical protein [Rhodospirillales bacterium]